MTGGNTSSRGYGWSHQKARAAALAAFVVGQPCVRCAEPMMTKRGLELDHEDDDRTRYRGLAHAECNRRAGGEKSARLRSAPWRRTSRDWERSWWIPRHFTKVSDAERAAGPPTGEGRSRL